MNTKLIVALVVFGVLAVTAVGMVAAQIAASNSNGTTSGTTNNGFFGWLGSCLGFRCAQNYGSTQTSLASNQPVSITVTDTSTSTTTNYQGHYGYGCGMMRSFP
jgi:hypothetical protein